MLAYVSRKNCPAQNVSFSNLVLVHNGVKQFLCKILRFEVAQTSKGKKTLRYNFLSNSSSLRPVFLTNTGLLSTSFTHVIFTTDFWYNTEVLSNGGSEEAPYRLG